MSGSGSLDELMPLFMQSHYWIMLTINVVVCIGLNVGLDIWANSNAGPKYYVVSPGNIGNMLLFSFVVSFFTFWNAGVQHKRILAGEAVPVTRRALTNNFFWRVFLFSAQEPSWKKRLFLYCWEGLLFPGVFLIISVSLLCMFATGFSSLGSADACEVSEAVNIVVIESWKVVGTVIIFTSMYAASHNEEQPEIADAVQNMLSGAIHGAGPGVSSGAGAGGVTGGALSASRDDLYGTKH
jgi:hypothetical protein